MTDLWHLPELGVGFIYWPSLDGLLDLEDQPIDVLELEPQAFWFPPRAAHGPFRLDQNVFDRLRSLPQRKLIHGVGFPVGGTVAPSPQQVAAFVESINVLAAPWASEHLSFNRVREGRADVDVGFLMPPVQSWEGATLAGANITTLKEDLPVPFAFETGVSYLKPMRGEISDGMYFATVARIADCGILLDLHNVWANERNGRQPVLDLIEELPLERVIELHLAGGQYYEGYWVDAHSGLIPLALMDLARQVVPKLPNLKAIIFEVMPQYIVAHGISKAQLVDQFWQLRDLWELRGKVAESRPSAQQRVGYPEGVVHSSRWLPSPSQWEDALAAVVTRHHQSPLDLVDDFHHDRGTTVVRALIGAGRAGKLADTLTLTTRLLLLTLGQEQVEQLLDDYWRTVPSDQMAADEAVHFVAHVTTSPSSSGVPYLGEVTAFELAAHRSVMTGEPQEVAFSVNPEVLLSALREGHLPEVQPTGNYVLTVSPPAQ